MASLARHQLHQPNDVRPPCTVRSRARRLTIWRLARAICSGDSPPHATRVRLGPGIGALGSDSTPSYQSSAVIARMGAHVAFSTLAAHVRDLGLLPPAQSEVVEAPSGCAAVLCCAVLCCALLCCAVLCDVGDAVTDAPGGCVN
jgi:hypothetical protein